MTHQTRFDYTFLFSSVNLTYIESVSGFELENSSIEFLLRKSRMKHKCNSAKKISMFSITKIAQSFAIYNGYCFKFSIKMKRDITILNECNARFYDKIFQRNRIECQSIFRGNKRFAETKRKK